MEHIRIGLLGDKREDYLPHYSAEPALYHAATHLNISVALEWIPSPDFSTLSHREKASFHAIWAGSGPYQDEEGAMEGIQYAREHKLPLLGSCSGFKLMVWECAKNVLKETDHYRSYISPLPYCSTDYQDVKLCFSQESLLGSMYGSSSAKEVTHCTFEIEPTKMEQLSEAGIFPCAVATGEKVKAVSLEQHPFYLACLFLPQVSSTEEKVSSIIKHFLLAASKVSVNSIY